MYYLLLCELLLYRSEMLAYFYWKWLSVKILTIKYFMNFQTAFNQMERKHIPTHVITFAQMYNLVQP